ncbi:MAG: hypothetical protein U0U09_11300 [Cyclobacteriaceae bacterium]
MERVKKLSVAYCKKILESSGKKYSDEETEIIRDLLYKLGELDYRISMGMNKSNNSTCELNKAA